MAKPAKKRGVRIPYVRDATGRKFGPDAIDVKPVPPYTTPLTCWECGVAVHVRHGNADDPDSKASCFVKNPGLKHGSRCPYDLERRGKELAEGSGRTVVRDDGQWRLICPPLPRPGTRDPGRKPPASAAGRPRPAGGPARTSQQAGQAIASARRIVRLLNAFGQDPAAVAEFAATVPGGRRNIAWPQFCRGRDDAHQLAQNLIDTGRSISEIPRAVWGPASNATAVDGRSGERSYTVQYTAAQPVLVGGRRMPLHVVMRSRNADWIGATTQSGQFLGYGYWRLYPAPENIQGRVELQLWIDEPWQADRWDTDGTTQTFPPLPPPRRRPAPSPRPAPPAPPAPVPAGGTREEPVISPTAPRALSENPAQGGPVAPPDPFTAVPPAGAEPEPAAGEQVSETAADRISQAEAPGAFGGPDLSPTAPAPATAEPRTAAAEDRTETPRQPVPPAPAVPPKPTQPPRPTSPPSTGEPRRRRLPGWLGRRGKRR
ncbi:hypothetical protein [Streptomyces sp. NBC_01789]|uniref:hypothetical protein n=1 Tax=Streptomyces sp. NBC_01789 TaxID=2975941 RepID=UPI002253297D|nr:hypothetical protein [Streptomyces sp. NBC_01789]MCX4451633.1 hypothetical protein [Streptomyces sp. NBC_01789]